MSQLTYYFNKINSFYYNKELSQIFSGNAVKITMPTNNSSLSVISLVNEGSLANYYTLNAMYISATSLYNGTSIQNSSYQLILEGNLNDYNGNSTNKILIMIPIFTDVGYTIQGKNNPITQINNLYMKNLLTNMNLDSTYPFLSGLDVNQFLSEVKTGIFYDNITSVDLTTTYTIVQLSSSNIWSNTSFSLSGSFGEPPRITTKAPSVKINLINNNKSIKTITQSDIYIDCSPTNTLGQEVNIYSSKDLDQLNFFKINDLKVWIFRFVTIFIIILIIFVTITIFQINNSNIPTVQQVQAQVQLK